MGLSSLTLVRRELEDRLRERLEQASRRYRTATQAYRSLLREESDGRAPSPDSPLALARQAESDALAEYSHVLRIFTDLTIYGKMPEENSVEAPAERVARRISVVDDDESIRDATKMLLRSAGYQVSTFACGEDFLNSDAVGQSDCVVLDIRMPGIDGLELQQRLNASQETVPLIFVTAHNDARSRRLAMDGGAVDFLCKPFAANSLVSAVETALTRRAVKRQAAKAT